MLLLIVGLILFLGAHSISIINEGWRDGMVARLGLSPWKGAYSVAAIVGFVLIVKGYAAARLDPIVLYTPPAWMAYVTALLMLFVFPLFVAAYFPGRIRTAAKHPMLAATKIWAFAHLLANGTLADVLLFGGFLAWAVADRISMKRRTPRVLATAPAAAFNDVIVIVLGLAIYALFLFWAHQALFGIAPIPS
jgi:uncharacterized membrane protein